MAAPEFSVHVSRLGATIVVAPHGELDLATCPRVRDELEREPGAPVLLDLRGVEFMDTSGVQLVVGLLRRGAEFGVVRGRAVQRVLDISGMTPHLRMVDTPVDLHDGPG